MAWLLRRILALWVRFTVLPEDAAARLQNTTHPVCYVLEHRSVTDLAVLQNACVQLKLPRPRKKLLAATKELRAAAKDLRSCFYLSRPLGFWDERLDRRPPPALTQIVELLRAHPELDFDLVPVAVYWGRAPQREASWFRLLLVEDWALTSRLRKFFQVLFNGRNTLLEFDDAISVRNLLGEGTANARRVRRALRLRYRALRAARIGPDLSHRRTIVAEILGTQAVRAAIAQEAREKKLTRHAALLEAQRLAEEIAANYSHAFVRFMEHLLTWLWNRLYSGVVFEHGATLDEVAEGHEIIYVPCHRSHMDYLLLSYVIYRHGHAIPHIAAGINLNLPIVGRLLRKGGAFFIRRSLRSSLYAVVFMNYLAAIMARGHSIEYFIEGGRSRTGRLLQPKTGMLSMTVRSFLRAPARPVAFVPVYFGYEHIVEGPTYIGELSGKPKQKESVFGLLRTLPRLLKRFGKVHVNVGEPILLAGLLDAYDAEWRARVAEDEGKLAWINTAIDELAATIMRNINAAAAVTPINLLAVALLASPRHMLVEADLLRQLQLYLALLADRPYGARVTVTKLTSEAIIAHGESVQLVSRRKHPLGDLVQMSEEAAALATYYRNNVLHLFAVPSLVACAFLANSVLHREDIERLAARIYPYIAAELFLRWREDEIALVVDGVLSSFERHGLLESAAGGSEWRRPAPTSAEAMQLSLLAQATLQTIERYYLTISLLLQAGSGEITQATLEKRCQLMAERMSLVYGFNSPEFFDRALFENFIDLLRKRGVVRAGAAGTLEFNDVLMRVAADAQLVLNEEIRHSILQVTHA